MKSSIWAGLGVLVLIIIGAAVWHYHARTVDAAPLVTEDNAILITDQKPGDDTVVSYAKLAQPGYIVIYANDTSGAKTVVGSSELLSSGEHRNVHVHHSGSKTVADDTDVSAVIVADDGDGSFSPDTDTDVVAEDTATVSDDAILDTDPSDADLSQQLEDAGYTPTDESEGDVTAPEGTPADQDTDVQGDTEQDDESVQPSDTADDGSDVTPDAAASTSDDVDTDTDAGA